MLSDQVQYECSISLISVGDPDPQDPHVLGLPDTDPNPLVRGTDPDPDPSLFSYMC